ncbi:zinc finger BED domain-containing protein 1-like [Sander lucioperca]|uniref:zinc finger BED domain-containing protein 1-like n=1 Tax=Sander lucioperca TaxID=283035 RepID=UPI00165367A1|nr:zinc finger BED domain-containing protein 1-like [Sander lucioperca]
MVNAMEPLLSYSNPRTPHQGLHSQAVRSDKGTRQSLPGQRGESCPDVRRLDLAHNCVTITAHFINEEWELVTYVLLTRDMPESHTGHNLAEHLRKALAEWGITEKDPSPRVPSDQLGSGKEIGSSTETREQLILQPTLFIVFQGPPRRKQFFKFLWLLNLAAQRPLKITAVAHLLGRVRRIVNFFRRSTTANHMLNEKQRLLRLPEHKLMMDVVTRWNSAHDMLERFLEQQPAICAALLSSEVRKTEKDLCTLTESDVTTVEEVVSMLKPMKEATQYMSKENTPTLSVVAPLQDTLINGLKPIEGESAVIKEMKAAMAGDLQKRCIDLKATLHACSVMDPRFKSFPFLTENERQEVYDGLIVEAARLSMQPSESLWSVDEEGTVNARADDEGMASKED